VRLHHPGPVTAAAFSPDGQVLFTGCAISKEAGEIKERPVGGQAQLWHTATGKPLGPALPHQGPVKDVAFSADGSMALTGGVVRRNPANPGLRGEARLVRAGPNDPLVGQLLVPIMEHPGPVWSVALSPTGQTVVTGS